MDRCNREIGVGMWKKKKEIKARAEYEEGRRTFHVVAITSSNDGRAVS